MLSAALLFVSSIVAVHAAGEADVPHDVAALAGRWIVDLRPSSDAPKYDKPMVLEIAPDRVVRGSFYDSGIEAGRASASNGRVCFAFRTTDGAGPYTPRAVSSAIGSWDRRGRSIAGSS